MMPLRSAAGGESVLVVEDDEAVLTMAVESLEDLGYRVLVANGGWDAIREFESSGTSVELLLTDVIMPDLTGPGLAERLRTQKPDLRVLFISGFHDADLVQRFVTRRGFALLPKPFTVDISMRQSVLAIRFASTSLGRSTTANSSTK